MNDFDWSDVGVLSIVDWEERDAKGVWVAVRVETEVYVGKIGPFPNCLYSGINVIVLSSICIEVSFLFENEWTYRNETAIAIHCSILLVRAT